MPESVRLGRRLFETHSPGATNPPVPSFFGTLLLGASTDWSTQTDQLCRLQLRGVGVRWASPTTLAFLFLPLMSVHNVQALQCYLFRFYCVTLQ